MLHAGRQRQPLQEVAQVVRQHEQLEMDLVVGEVIALSKVINSKLYGFGKDWITRLIRDTQNRPNNTEVYQDAA